MLSLNKNRKIKFKLEDINFEDEIMNISCKKVSQNIDIDKAKLILQLVNRTTKKVKEINLTSHNEQTSKTISYKININDNINFFEKGIVDLYIKNKKTKETYRIKSSSNINVDTDFYYDTQKNNKIYPYTTVKGNLSIKLNKANHFIHLDDIDILEDGYLVIKGYVIIPKWEIEDIKSTKKEIVISLDENRQKAITMENLQRKDITKKYKALNRNLDYSGFACKINLFDEDIYDLRNKLLDIHIRITYRDESITIPIIDKNNEYTKEAYIKSENTVCKVTLKNNKQHLKILINNSNEEIQLNTIYINDEEIDISINLSSLQTYNIFNKNQIYLKLIERKTKKEILINTKIKEDKLIVNINTLELVNNNNIKNGIFDMYISIDDRDYRLVNKADGILNKQKIVNLPQIIIPNNDNTAIAIKSYYTLQEELSLLVRNPIEIKKINSIKIDSQGILIKGLLNIQQPNNNIPNEAPGKIIIKARRGKKFHIDGTWKLSATGKTTLEFKFEFTMCEEYKKYKFTQEDILQDINFDLISCEFKVEDKWMRFLMNVDPSKVKAKQELKRKKAIRIEKYINKNKLSLYKFFNKLPINNNLAVFQSFHGKSYSGNPKAIYETLLKEKSRIKSVWVLNDINKNIVGNPIIVRPNTIEYYYYMATAKYFINNGNFPDFYEKREGTIHLQTWHGTPLKKLGFDIDENSPAYKENTSEELMRRIERWDYLIEPNKYTGDILKRAFKFNKEIISSGYPRNDILIKQERKKIIEIKEILNIPRNKKVILYAPTWRDYEFHSGATGQPYEFKFDMERFKEEFSHEYVLLLRLHYRDASRINISGYENIVYNVSSYDDIQELYLISDILITDYSSVMFDFANLDRPMIFFTYDLKRYGSQVRGFYFNFIEEAPGPVVLNQDRLFESIKNIDKVKENYKERYSKFREKFCSLEDGNASKRVIDKVFK